MSLVPKIVLFGALPRAKNRALDRAFWCSPSCQKLCFLVLSFVPQTVLFGAFLRTKNRALDRTFWCSPSCQKSCSRSCSLLQLLGLCQDIPIFGGYPKTILDGCIHCSSYKMNASRHFLPQLCMDYVPAVWWLYHCYNTISSFPHSCSVS